MRVDAIPDLATRRAALTPDATAIKDLSRDTTLTYSQLEERACRAAGLLAGLGVEAGDRIALLCRNRAEFFELLFACAKLSAILVPLNWRMPAAELSPLIIDAAPSLLLYGNEDIDVAEALDRPELSLLALDDSGPDGYPCRRNQSEANPGRALWPEQECWYLLYTSGTTGDPKAVIQTFGMAITNYVNIRQAMSISAGDVTLSYLPLFYTAGINLVALPTLLEGGSVLVLPGLDIEHCISLFDQGALDTFFGVPAVYQQLCQHARFDTLDLSRIRSWGCGGAPMPDDLIRRYLERGARVCNGMGMTESGPTIFIMDAGAVADKIGSVGKPQLLASVRIVDEDGNDVQPGQNGELWFAGPGITPGYWKNSAATAEVFSDGWLKTGDIGRCDEDGYYYIVGRIKDMFISGGVNVYPAEVEKVLAGHSAIDEVVVVGRPDRQWGEIGCAYLTVSAGHQVPPDDELIDYCRQRLASFKVPKSFVTVDTFPRTAAGKIQKNRL